MKALIDGDTRWCSSCKSHKSRADFHKQAHYCKVCANAKARQHHHRRMMEDPLYRDKKKDAHVRTTHGVSLEQYNAMLEQQRYCAICNVDLLSINRSLVHYDHCHASGKYRSFLCTNCNRGLGHFKDSIESLETAIKYLKEHKHNGKD